MIQRWWSAAALLQLLGFTLFDETVAYFPARCAVGAAQRLVVRQPPEGIERPQGWPEPFTIGAPISVPAQGTLCESHSKVRSYQVDSGELHLVVLWPRLSTAVQHQMLRGVLASSLIVRGVWKGQWAQPVQEAYRRFYGKYYYPVDHAGAKGHGEIVAILVEDQYPQYKRVNAHVGRSAESVNAKMYELKTYYRRFAQAAALGDWLVHASLNIHEATHDVFKLLGMDIRALQASFRAPWCGEVRPLPSMPGAVCGLREEVTAAVRVLEEGPHQDGDRWEQARERLEFADTLQRMGGMEQLQTARSHYLAALDLAADAPFVAVAAYQLGVLERALSDQAVPGRHPWRDAAAVKAFELCVSHQDKRVLHKAVHHLGELHLAAGRMAEARHQFAVAQATASTTDDFEYAQQSAKKAKQLQEAQPFGWAAGAHMGNWSLWAAAEPKGEQELSTWCSLLWIVPARYVEQERWLRLGWGLPAGMASRHAATSHTDIASDRITRALHRVAHLLPPAQTSKLRGHSTISTILETANCSYAGFRICFGARSEVPYIGQSVFSRAVLSIPRTEATHLVGSRGTEHVGSSSGEERVSIRSFGDTISLGMQRDRCNHTVLNLPQAKRVASFSNPIRDPLTVENCPHGRILVNGYHRLFEALFRGYTGQVVISVKPCRPALMGRPPPSSKEN